MTTLISITEYPSMPGRYRWSVKTGKKEFFGEAGQGPESAAASAVDKAITFSEEGGYSIFAPKAVLSLIPEDLRNSRPIPAIDDMSVDSLIHLRVPANIKARWVSKSRAQGMRLTDWVVQIVEQNSA